MGAKHSRQNLLSSDRRESMRTQNTTNSNSNTSNTNNSNNNNNNNYNHTASNSAISQSANSIIIEGRQYHNLDSSTYCLPRDELEQDRLNSQHFSLKALLEGNVLPSIPTSLPRNAKVLDLGCGSGCWVMEMAIDYPEYEMTGVDMADMFPTTIRPENVKFDLINILDGLPYPDNYFDFVHMRLMIIAFRSSEWDYVLKEIFRVLKPGGLVELVESDFTEKTNVQIVETFNGEFFQAMQEAGQDPWIGSKLSGLLSENQFDVYDVQERYLSYGKSFH
ncbi:unnamed protein product [Mucor hiemalis]